MAQKKKSKIKIKWIVIAVVIVAVIVAAAVILILNGGIAGAVNAIAGRPAEEYYYEHSGKTAYASVGRGLAAVSSSQLTVWNERGEETLSQLLSFSGPEVSASGDWAAAWDLGGTEVIVFTERGLRYRLSLQETVVSVSVNSSGYVAVSAEEKGYGGAVTVYNPDGKALYKAYSGKKYVLSAAVKGKTELLVLAIGDGVSELSVYNITEENLKARYTHEGLILDAGFNASGVTAVTEEGLIFLDGGLKIAGQYSLGGKFLAYYAVRGDFSAIAVGDYRLGGARELITVGNDGTEIARKETGEDIRWLEAGDKALAVLTPGGISLMTRELSETDFLTAPAGCGRALMRDDTTVIAVGDYSATVLSADRQKKGG